LAAHAGTRGLHADHPFCYWIRPYANSFHKSFNTVLAVPSPSLQSWPEPEKTAGELSLSGGSFVAADFWWLAQPNQSRRN